MNLFKIDNADFSNLISGLQVSYETLVSESSGTNANGDMVIDIVNTKRKITVSFRYMTTTEMESLLDALNPYVVNVSYLDPKTGIMKSAQTYVSAPAPQYYSAKLALYNPMQITFEEL